MIGFRDTLQAGAHQVVLNGVALPFDDAGILRNPTPRQLDVMQLSAMRRERFVQVEQVQPGPGPIQPVAQAASSATEAAPVAAEDHVATAVPSEKPQ